MTMERSQQDILKQLRQVALMVMQAAQADTLEQMLQRIADIARDLIGAKYAALGVPDQAGGLRLFKVSGISQEEISRIPHPPVGLGLLGSIMQQREPLRLDDISVHPHAVGFPEGHPHMKTLLGIPIQLGDHLFGIFYLSDRIDGKPFNEDDQWMLEIMAGYAALVIAEKYLHDQRSQITLMREREQIGMTLHDSVIQSLYALGMRLDLAKRSRQVTMEDIDVAMEGLNQVIEDIRHAIFQLSNEENQDSLTLRRRIRNIMTQLYIPPDLEISLNLPEHSLPLPSEILDTIEMMVNECLSNVIRHAQAKQVTIEAKDEGDKLEVMVRDNGKGFDSSQMDLSQGLGLRNLQRRARMHGGTANIESQPSLGTQVRITIPLD